ncbi:MAG: YdeI family protein [Thermoleophilia bacterium]
MSRGASGPRYEAFLRAAEPWRDELAELRRIVLACGLAEEVKWGAPCFTADGGNVVILGVLNDYCCLSFFKGVLLSDPEGILVAPGENSRSGRLIPFTAVDQILAREETLTAYVHEAAELERSGARVDFAKDRDQIAIPDELRGEFSAHPGFEDAWDALTPGRRRGWLLHFTGAKQSATRTSRIRRAMPRILDGKGMHDR